MSTNHYCVGLDPDPKRFSKQFESGKYAILDFCWDIVQSTGDLVCAFKPQIAYFASSGAEDQLKELIARIHSEYPEVPSFLMRSAGTSVQLPSIMRREPSSVSAPTASRFLHTWVFDSVEPYLEYPDKGAFILLPH